MKQDSPDTLYKLYASHGGLDGPTHIFHRWSCVSLKLWCKWASNDAVSNCHLEKLNFTAQDNRVESYILKQSSRIFIIFFFRRLMSFLIGYIAKTTGFSGISVESMLKFTLFRCISKTLLNSIEYGDEIGLMPLALVRLRDSRRKCATTSKQRLLDYKYEMAREARCTSSLNETHICI